MPLWYTRLWTALLCHLFKSKSTKTHFFFTVSTFLVHRFMVYTFDVVIESVVIEIYNDLLGTWFTPLFVNLGNNFKSGSWLIESYKIL